MSGITLITALEIFTNPKDLQISIGKKGNSKYMFVVSRGPDHNFKPLISTTPFAETVDIAVEEIKKLLEMIQLASLKQMKDRDSFLTQVLNPNGTDLDMSKLLNTDLINYIINELKQRQVANTYETLAVAGNKQL